MRGGDSDPILATMGKLGERRRQKKYGECIETTTERHQPEDSEENPAANVGDEVATMFQLVFQIPVANLS
ncbi:hypothetical protein Y1Q_0020449 [Alligator mississippiensis]|uniref:Uncharacterized protein n=1 Tax=Alligator mississippiensis TaxID=8496 RepID=A0A151N7N0_ALLMI|nr:hypothetical protein Y1Q_0020449 [Alligator mississippiensis]